MKLSAFDFILPPELIAQYPAPVRSASRLMTLNGDTGAVEHRLFSDFLSLINTKDLIVFNNTKVIPARLFGTKQSGGKVEILVERLLDDFHALAHVRASKSPKAGSLILLPDNTPVTVLGRQQDLFQLQFPSSSNVLDTLNRLGHIPLPPYMNRADEDVDKDRYQTVYAQKEGAVAAPTAGLHFDEPLLAEIKKRNINTAFVTLHVGAGTFQPVRVDNIETHRMHAEWVEVSSQTCEAVVACKQNGGRVIAVGTTTVRSLESACRHGQIQAFRGDTDIFIYPGISFNCVDAMVTNFHLPQSTLLMMVSAFAGYRHVIEAYQAAIREKYRFFSYGDAMFITRNRATPSNLAAEVTQEI